ncbi:MAG TPA: polymer-forming cytoskeletal protein [Patescibacteria group bacterium]|nr:polymer-forming cytoskeletal protein [Patescibacteria group bacterium]
MSIEKKTIRSDIPGHHTMLSSTMGFNVGNVPNDEGRRLVVGRDITLNGAIASCDHLVIEGTVHADSFNARRIDILEVGCFVGNTELTDAVIAGRFEGKLNVSGRLTVKSTGRIIGEISYGSLEVEAGAKIEGKLASIAVAAVAETVSPAVVDMNTNDNATETKAEGGEDEQSEDRPRIFRRTSGF